MFKIHCKITTRFEEYFNTDIVQFYDCMPCAVSPYGITQSGMRSLNMAHSIAKGRESSSYNPQNPDYAEMYEKLRNADPKANITYTTIADSNIDNRITLKTDQGTFIPIHDHMNDQFGNVYLSRFNFIAFNEDSEPNHSTGVLNRVSAKDNKNYEGTYTIDPIFLSYISEGNKDECHGEPKDHLVTIESNEKIYQDYQSRIKDFLYRDLASRTIGDSSPALLCHLKDDKLIAFIGDTQSSKKTCTLLGGEYGNALNYYYHCKTNPGDVVAKNDLSSLNCTEFTQIHEVENAMIATSWLNLETRFLDEKFEL